ncbi:four helix bundle protein [Amniculibacterium sp. G2-70]|uniref:four helix bundle protein n=1 Tax=Amniculibacterium sp. G2-70 TaxID=2767188 RepID=UPI0016546515|nr:four helix bundle protein [Amniculibacterium sp. G2-70]
MESNIQSHKDLKVWQEAMELVIDIYRLVKDFPDYEKYILANQMRRSSISIPSNIAEGFARQGTKELIHYLYIALGSLSELETQLEIAIRLKYTETSDEYFNRIKFIRILLSKLIHSMKSKQP